MADLQAVCEEAARDLLEREGRPLPSAAVLPLPEATKVTTFPDFPDDDATRFDLLVRFAQEVMRPANAPAYGFVAEATAQADQGTLDVVVVAWGASGQRPQVAAAPLTADELGPFTQAEELDPAALPFLSPLQHAAEAATPPGDGLPPPGGRG